MTFTTLGDLTESRPEPNTCPECGYEECECTPEEAKVQFEEGAVSYCCAAPDRSNGDMTYSDIGICPECKEHCEFLEAK